MGDCTELAKAKARGGLSLHGTLGGGFSVTHRFCGANSHKEVCLYLMLQMSSPSFQPVGLGGGGGAPLLFLPCPVPGKGI